jgi:hypothetical protein
MFLEFAARVELLGIVAGVTMITVVYSCVWATEAIEDQYARACEAIDGLRKS